MVAAPRSGAALRRSVGRPGRRGPSRRPEVTRTRTPAPAREASGAIPARSAETICRFSKPGFGSGCRASLRARRPGSRTPTRRTQRRGVRSKVEPRVGSTGARDAAQEGALRVLARFSGASADSAPCASDGADALPERRPTRFRRRYGSSHASRARSVTSLEPSRRVSSRSRARNVHGRRPLRAHRAEILLIRSNGNNRLVGASPDPRVD